MDCPQCKGYRLEPYEIEAGLLASRCGKCSGTLLPLMNYRYWVDNNPDFKVDLSTELVAEDSDKAKICPKCSRMMTKFKIGMEPSNKLELCTSCDEAWLDHGEWQLLKTLDIHNQLPSIFTDAWQRNIRIKQQENKLQTHYQKEWGEETFEKVDNFKQWLNQQPTKSSIVQYLITKAQ